MCGAIIFLVLMGLINNHKTEVRDELVSSNIRTQQYEVIPGTPQSTIVALIVIMKKYGK